MPVNIAVVGSGWVTLNRHIPALLRGKDLRLAGVIGRNRESAGKIARKYGLRHCSAASSLSTVDWLAEVDAVVIGTPPEAHAEQAREALALGKHVLVEKPFAMTVEEAESMVSAARGRGLILAAMHNFLFSKGARKLAAAFARGEIGALRRVSVVHLGNPVRGLPEWHERLPLGSFYDESAHIFYLLRSFAGRNLRLEKACGVAAADAGRKTPALVSLLYRNDAGVPVTIDCQFDSPVSEWYLLLSGEKALGIYDIYRDMYIRLPNDGKHKTLNVLLTSYNAVVQHALQHITNGFDFLRGHMDYGSCEVFSRFADAISGGTEALFGIGAGEAVEVLRMQQEAAAAVRENLLA